MPAFDPDTVPMPGGHFIGDFIGGMTDRFAIAKHEEIVGPVNLPANRF